MQKGEKMEKYFWTEDGEFAHIIETSDPEESPCGNDGQHYAAFCGTQGNSWTMHKISGHILANDEQIAKSNKPVCFICKEISNNIKVQKAILRN